MEHKVRKEIGELNNLTGGHRADGETDQKNPKFQNPNRKSFANL